MPRTLCVVKSVMKRPLICAVIPAKSSCALRALSDLSKLHLLVPIQIENDEYRMVCDQCSERASMMHCHLYQVSTCSVCAGIHLYNLSQQHIVLTFPNQNTVVDTQDIEINDAVSSQNESRINRLLQCEPCIIQSKKLNSGAIRSLPPSSNTGEWWISSTKIVKIKQCQLN